MARSRQDDDFDDDRPRSRDGDYSARDDDRPRRQRRVDRMDEYDDMPRSENDGPKKMSVLGLLSLIGGIFSLIFSFIPCIGAFAIVGGAIGLLMGGIGLGVAGRYNHGKGLPVASIIVNLLSIIIASVWIFLFASAANKANKLEVENGEALKVTAAQIDRDFNLNFAKAEIDYNGKIVEVTGQVKLVSKERVGRITVEIGSRDETIDCDFSTSAKAELAGLENGQTITIRGKCKGKDRKSNYVVVSDCKLVKVDAAVAVEAIKVEAAKLIAEYKKDLKAANLKYKGKLLEISGTLASSANVKQERVLNFGNKRERYIECRLTPEASRDAGTLEVSKQLTVRGTCSGPNAEDTIILIENASIVK